VEIGHRVDEALHRLRPGRIELTAWHEWTPLQNVTAARRVAVAYRCQVYLHAMSSALLVGPESQVAGLERDFERIAPHWPHKDQPTPAPPVRPDPGTWRAGEAIERLALVLLPHSGAADALESQQRLASRAAISLPEAHRTYYELRTRGLVRRTGRLSERIELTAEGRAARSGQGA
jgi:hypothetical protein